jgi:hypothetical protein
LRRLRWLRGLCGFRGSRFGVGQALLQRLHALLVAALQLFHFLANARELGVLRLCRQRSGESACDCGYDKRCFEHPSSPMKK